MFTENISDEEVIIKDNIDKDKESSDIFGEIVLYITPLLPFLFTLVGYLFFKFIGAILFFFLALFIMSFAS